MCIVHSTLRDATTPYTERCNAFEKRLHKTNLKLKNHTIQFNEILEIKK
jgi:hypothetical protein